MKKIKIRFNTECKDPHADNSMCWRALIDEEEFLASEIEINVPTKTISHTLEDGRKKWSIYCESDNYYFDDNKKLIINDSINYDEYVLYPGRYQPPHSGHMTIFNESLSKNKKICIAIRNVKPDEKNPLPSATVKMLWEKIYDDNPLVKVIIIPNISGIKYGRNVGFSVDEIIVSSEIANISATQIRNQIASGSEDWKKIVDPKIWDDVIALLGRQV